MSHRRILSVWILLVLAAQACGAPVQTSVPPPTAEPIAPTATSAAEPPIAFSLAEAIAAGVDSGEWPEGQGVVRGLRYLVGELSPAEAFAGAPLLNGEGTGIIRLAQTRLAEGALAEGDRAEVERVLAILLPSPETLELLSQPSSSSRGTPGIAAPAPRPTREVCQDLWASGFSLPFPVQCLEFDELAVGGRTYRVYYPSYWPADDERRELLSPAFEALEASIHTYNGYGPEPVFSTDIVFTELESLAYDEAGRVERDPETGIPYRDPGTYAAAIEASGGERCLVGVFPAAVDLALVEGEDAFRQTIAHELFHCYQYTNLSAEESGPARSATEWWIEGSAEFYGAVVYPNVNDEFQYLGGFRERSATHSLLTLSYHAYPFFQYLAVQDGLGADGVIQVLRAMPETGGLEDQQSALAGLSGIEEAFHEFGRAYLDRQLQDYGGGTLPLEPSEGPAPAAFGIGEGEGFFSAVGPFQLKHYRMRFAEHARFRNTPTIEGVGKVGARAASAVGAWGQVPTELNTSCGEPEYIVLVTSAVPPGTDTLSLALATLGEEVDEEIGCDECVVGTWNLVNATYLRHMGGVWPTIVGMLPALGLSTDGAQMTPTNVFGLMQLQFKPDGTVEGRQEGWGISGVATHEGDTLHSTMTYSGGGEANWRIEEDPTSLDRYLFFDAGEFGLTGTMTWRGLPMPVASVPTGGSNDPVFLSSPQPFLCDATSLTYYAEDTNGPIVFLRASGE